MLAHQAEKRSPERYLFWQEYCIIFGAATQSRTSVHCLAVIFVPSFLCMECGLKYIQMSEGDDIIV